MDKNNRIFNVLSPFVEKAKVTVTPLKGGSSKGELFHFAFNAKQYVLRLFPPQANPSTRKHQIDLAKQAGNIGVGPEVYFIDSQWEGIIMQFLPGSTVQPKDFENPNHLAHFAKLLQKLHNSKESFPVAISPFQRFRKFYQQSKHSGIAFPARFSEVNALMNELEALFQIHSFPQVPTHLDLHPLNIMLHEQNFTLVDWVNGGISDPYFDLTTFATFHSLKEPQIMNFLTYYFERPPTLFEWNRFIITQPIRLFVITAALLNTASDISYDEEIQYRSLPSIEDFVNNTIKKTSLAFRLDSVESWTSTNRPK